MFKPTAITPLTAPPLRHRVLTSLRRDIAALTPGTRLPAQDELAGRYGVSVLSVREAMSVLVGEGVVNRRAGSGTYVADPTRNQWLAVATELDLASHRTSYTFRSMVRHARDTVLSAGMRCRVYFGRVEAGDDADDMPRSGTTCDALVEDLDAGRIAGAVMVASDARSPLQRRLESARLPVVNIGGGGDVSVMHEPRTQVLGHALRHLVNAGRRQVAVMSWGHAGEFITAARALGLDLKPEWVRCDLHPARPGTGWEEFREIWSARPEKPDGVIVLDDVLFSDALPAITQTGARIPDDLMIVAEVPDGASVFVPMPITRVLSDPRALGIRAAERLMQLARGEAIDQGNEVLPVRLVDTGADRTPAAVG